MKFSEGKRKMDDLKKEAIPERSQMNTKYANLMLFRLLEVLYDSKGKGVRFRTCILGKEDIVDHYKDEGLQFSTKNWAENRDRCRDFLKEQGIIKDLSCDIEKNEAEITIQSCIHIPVEEMLKNEEVPPYTCIPANLFAYGIEKATGKQTEIAKIETGQEVCKIKMLFFQEED
jgi:hypothetical protein